MAQITIDPSVAEAYNDVRNDKTPTNWAIFQYADDVNGGAPTTITFKAKGESGLDGLKAALDDSHRSYGFLRVIAGDELSARAKFVLISYVPDKVPIKKRAAVSTHKGFVKEVVKDFAIEVHATNSNELNGDDILKSVKKAGGASYGNSST